MGCSQSHHLQPLLITRIALTQVRDLVLHLIVLMRKQIIHNLWLFRLCVACIPPLPTSSAWLMLGWSINRGSGTAKTKVPFYRSFTHLKYWEVLKSVLCTGELSLNNACWYTVIKLWDAHLGDVEITQTCFQRGDPVTEERVMVGSHLLAYKSDVIFCSCQEWEGIEALVVTTGSEQRNVIWHLNQKEILIPLSPAFW